MHKPHFRFTAMFLVLALAFAGVPAVFADGADDQAFSLLPIRSTFEEAGGSVYWDGESRSIRVDLEGAVYLLYADSPAAQRNEEAISLQQGVVFQEDRAYISDTDLLYLVYGLEPDTGYLGTTINTVKAAAGQVMDLLSIAGMTVAVVDAELGFTWTQGFGFADEGVLVDENTLFGMGSISKSFTATAVMQLVEAGVIDLDEPVVTYLPDFRVPAEPMTGAGDYRKITPRMLLSHASGLQTDWLPGFMTTDDYYPAYMTDFFSYLTDLPMQSAEASMFSYSNAAYTVLGILVAAMSGEDNYFDGFVSYVHNHVLSPLGMDSTTFLLEDRHMPYLSKPYIDAATQDDFIFMNTLSAGGLYSNAHDMARFMQAILNGGAYDGEGGRVLSPNSVKQMMTLQDFDFQEAPTLMGDMRLGMGFYQTTGLDGFTYMGHGGNLIHYHSGMAFDLDSGLGVLVSVNSISGIATPKYLAASILQSAVMEKTGDPGLPASDDSVAPAALAREELEKLAGFYSFAGAEELIVIEVQEDGILSMRNMPGSPLPLELAPLSDGSFVNPDLGIRFWFDDFQGETIIYLGEFRSILAGGKLDPEMLVAGEGFSRWVGTYDPVLPEGQVSGFINAIVAIDDNGFGYLKAYTLHGQASYSPLIAIDGDYYVGGLTFSTDEDGNAWLHVQGLGMLRDDTAN
ncbi:MAG: serine hydrolase [Clostridiales bacterium]|nr:serine hydrolase [Clostridiales bacterium]